LSNSVTVGEGENSSVHAVGNKDCDVGWCVVEGFPQLCSCGGLVHGAFGEFNKEEWCFWIALKCDKCGVERRELGAGVRRTEEEQGK
jgi:hypothetical protein